MSLTVVEVVSRSQEGRTHPYICRCDDGELYFVKGISATRPGLIAEWICAQLGHVFGLPLSDNVVATVPDELIEADFTGSLADLGAGEVFASKRINATDLTDVHRTLVPVSTRRDVVMFDWWVRNGDRTLTKLGGNVNLLWNPSGDGSLVVIDHNLAFDPTFSEMDFCNLHVFSDEIPTLFSDFVLRDLYKSRFATALEKWDESCATLPLSWSFIDPELTVPVNFPFVEIKNLLYRAFDDAFWKLPQ